MPIAGIGASAGGLEAFRLLLAHLPADTGLAFVFIQHLDPKRHSNLTEILTRISPVPVETATNGHPIERNHLYVIPADVELEIANQALRLTPRAPASSGPHPTIDHFLRSLAQECGSRAIGVVLSGGGSDGAAGLEALKAAGGIGFAQDPATAKFDNMPRAAIDRGCVDLVLPPEAIAVKLAKLGQHPFITEDENTLQPTPATNGWFDSILTLLRNATGIDFALYHETTVRRRILRRLALRDVRRLDEYCEQLERDPGALSALHRDLLISVPSFFRDRESFEDLKKLVLPRLIEHRPRLAPIRIWAAGCATGEEAYSIAISLMEYFEERGCLYPVQIFASGSSAAAVEKGRSGKYAENIATDVGPERLHRHFSKIDGGYQVSKTLRDMCVFSRHDVIHDPPFSKLDLIICQNVLISAGSARALMVELFHYALKPGGFLVLGRSETESGDLFSIVPGTHSIYVRNETAAKQHLFYRRRSADAYDRLSGSPAEQPAKAIDVRKEVERRLLSRFEGTGIVLDKALEVLEILGLNAPYLSRPTKKKRLKLRQIIPDTTLFGEVEKLVRQVQGSGMAARKHRVPYQAGGAPGEINVEVAPLGGARPRGFLVLFETVRGELEIQLSDSDPRDLEIARLKQDLADARQRLLSIIEDQLSAAEESQNVAAESISANEELQCLNEELETAKEELQSSNEQLNAVNEELQSNNAALTEARDFAMSVIDAAATPLLVLDTKLRIKTANPSFYRAFRLSAAEAQGQLIFSLSNGAWDIPRLRDMLQQILPGHKSVQGFEIAQTFPEVGHRVLVLNARQLDGLKQILLGIDDVTERQKRAEATLHESEGRFRTMADAAPVMIWVADPHNARTFFNRVWLLFTGRTLQQELGNGWTASVYPEDLNRCLDTYSSSFHARRSFQVEYRLRRQDGEYRWILDNGVPRYEPSGTFVGYIGSCVDITDVKRAETEKLTKQKLESVGKLASGIAHDFNNLLSGVLASSELALAELSGGSSATEELKRIRAAAIRGAEIVRQLMIYAGQESEVLESVDVSQIVEEMIELLTLSVSKRVTLETDLRKSLPPVRANRGQVRQVVMNLITNASDAIGDRKGLIRVTTRRVAVDPESTLARSRGLGHGDYVQLEVSDTGGGITLEMQAKVFDPFFTTKPAGHGLGLAVVQGIVRRLGGIIRLVSALGKGTMFQILLPCREGEPQGTTPRPISDAKADKIRPAEATILVVEDEDLIRRAISKMLHKQGFSVIEASDGSVALDLIRALDETLDVLVLDVTLPGASSREVFEEAKRLRPAMPVIVSSANTQEMAAASLAGKVERFIRKPFSLNDLSGLIRETLVSS